MLPQKHRLMLRHFPNFFVQSKKIHYNSLFSLYVLSTDNSFSRGTVIVPKKYVAKASARNHIKRQVSEVLYSLFKTKQNVSIVVLVKKPLDTAALEQLKTMLIKL